MKKSLLMGAVGLLTMGVVSCSSNPPPQQPPPPPPPATTPVAATPTNTPCDAGQIQQITTQFAGRVGTEAPKMEPEGPMICQSVPEGGAATSGQDFTMYPGFCYTVLGTGLPSVQTISLAVTLDPAAAGFPPALAAFVALPVMADNQPTLMNAAGAAPNCYKYALPIPGTVKLTVTAKVGQGPVAAQVYKRKLAPNEMPTGTLHM